MRPMLLVHILAAALALVTGYVALFARKGARLHRRSGLLFTYAMIVMGLAGMAVAVLHVRLALDARWPALTRTLIGVAGVSLFFAMVLAALYASRAFMRPFGWLGLPQMQAFHGTVNVLGFGLCGVLGWRRAARSGLAGPPV